MSSLQTFCEVGEQAARAAGAVLLDWAPRISVREKGPSDLVTEADVAAQEEVRQILLSAFPKHGLLGEENASIPSRDNGYRWIVDPLDGTTNYVHGIPFYCVSIALEQHGELAVGVVYDPVSGECFTARRCEGAYLNGRKLNVSQVQQLCQAVVASSFPPQVLPDAVELRQFVDLTQRTQSMRRMGSSALNLCYVAAGRYDAYWSQSTKLWDIAAGVLLVQEAGGMVTDPSGEVFRIEPPHFIAAASSSLHRELSGVLNARS